MHKHEDARAEAAILSAAEAYRLVDEARQQRNRADEEHHLHERVEAENERLRAALAEIAEGCGHTRCHAYPWIRAARKALG